MPLHRWQDRTPHPNLHSLGSALAATGCNDHSSRSHFLCLVSVRGTHAQYCTGVPKTRWVLGGWVGWPPPPGGLGGPTLLPPGLHAQPWPRRPGPGHPRRAQHGGPRGLGAAQQVRCAGGRANLPRQKLPALLRICMLDALHLERHGPPPWETAVMGTWQHLPGNCPVPGTNRRVGLHLFLCQVSCPQPRTCTFFSTRFLLGDIFDDTSPSLSSPPPPLKIRGDHGIT